MQLVQTEDEKQRKTQNAIDSFYLNHGDCCAGCDHWRWFNSVTGECIRAAPVSGSERLGLISVSSVSVNIEAGHIMTNRDHVCGDFFDSEKTNV